MTPYHHIGCKKTVILYAGVVTLQADTPIRSDEWRNPDGTPITAYSQIELPNCPDCGVPLKLSVKFLEPT